VILGIISDNGEEYKIEVHWIQVEGRGKHGFTTKERIYMKVKFLGKTEFLILTHDRVYDVIGVEKGWYRIIDDSGDDYLYPPECFDIIEQ